MPIMIQGTGNTSGVLAGGISKRLNHLSAGLDSVFSIPSSLFFSIASSLVRFAVGKRLVDRHGAVKQPKLVEVMQAHREVVGLPSSSGK